MQHAAGLLRDLPPTVADAPQAGDEWARSPVSALSDAALVDAAAEAIAAPKHEADSSFLTHAPLELAARAGLLPMVAPGARDQARRRIAAIAAEYARQGDEVETTPKNYADQRAALRALIAALREGDADDVDAVLLYLAPRASVLDLRGALVDEVTPMLGAAAHAPILLAELPRLEARVSGAAGTLARAVAPDRENGGGAHHLARTHARRSVCRRCGGGVEDAPRRAADGSLALRSTSRRRCWRSKQTPMRNTCSPM